MTESYLDGLLDDLVHVEPRESWDDVLHRARRAQRRYAILVVAIAVLVLAPATWAAIHAFEGTPPPPKIQRTFLFAFVRMNKGLPKRYPHVIVDKAHGVLQVQTRSGPLDLWAAPTTNGGSCFWIDWESHMGPVDTATGLGACPPKHFKPGTSAGTASGAGRYVEIYGYAWGSEVSARVKLTSGRTLTLPVVEHYFLGVARNGADVVSVAGLDANGRCTVEGAVRPAFPTI
jgi:hypothetical protein